VLAAIKLKVEGAIRLKRLSSCHFLIFFFWFDAYHLRTLVFGFPPSIFYLLVTNKDGLWVISCIILF
jgi:hypothetical protein